VLDLQHKTAAAPPQGQHERPVRERTLLMTIRQALIMILGALEDYLGEERSIIPRRKR
jgi:hypothetical protein